jgi:hypothetical protein
VTKVAALAASAQQERPVDSVRWVFIFRQRDPATRIIRNSADLFGGLHYGGEARCKLPVELLRRQLLEVAGVEAGRIVDQHVDAAEPIDRGPHCRLGIDATRDV